VRENERADDENLRVSPRFHQFLGFAGIGALATAIQYGILAFAVEVLGASAVVGSSAGFFLSAIINYALNYRFTFRSDQSHGQTAIRFVLVAAAGLALNAALMSLLTGPMRVRYLIAQLAASALVLIWNFLGNAMWTFARRRQLANSTIAGGNR